MAIAARTLVRATTNMVRSRERVRLVQNPHLLWRFCLTLSLLITWTSLEVSAHTRKICAFTAGNLAPTTKRKRSSPHDALSCPRPKTSILQAPSMMDLIENPIIDNEDKTSTPTAEVVDNRPFAQRVNRVRRPARRLNHGFKYLYRHEDNSMPIVKNDGKTNNNATMTSVEFLVKYGGYSEQQVYDMNQSFPPLLSLDVQRHLRPKLRFLQETICGGSPHDHGDRDTFNSSTITRTLSENVRKGIPPQYYGARLERTIAPRHAFLVHQNLPHGQQLLDDNGKGGTLWQDFLAACRKPKQFCALCNSWKQQYPHDDHGAQSTRFTSTQSDRITIKQIDAFDTLFQRGLMPASRNELCQNNNPWPLDYVNVSSGDMIELLIQHGANPLERDARGASLLHWAAGCGNLDAVKCLLPYFPEGVLTATERDGATPLHWAAAGANAREFGIGGHTDVCRYLLEEQGSTGNTDSIPFTNAKQLANNLTKDGNSVLMWASWSGTLDAVKLLVRNRADSKVANRNGCTVAHWATSGGNLEVCRYLAETVGVDFTVPNNGGNTPLTHAVAFGRVDVVEWLRSEICKDDQEDDMIAAQLAKDFVGWTEGDENRQQVLSLFEDWYGVNQQSTASSSSTLEDDDDNDFEFY
mmetsp:Transcript_18089/g.27966  ORF Transcript_18089/g.27966 Transcript_18089/m.27966 type:complete len:638 (+) Transcript_18089:104-2017(+)